jgi:hypothetical protein
VEAEDEEEAFEKARWKLEHDKHSRWITIRDIYEKR